MKKFLLPLLAILIAFSSCKSIYKCGDPVPEKAPKLMGKRLKAVVKERDMLCKRISDNETTIDALNTENDSLNSLIRTLNTSNDSLNKQLDYLNKQLDVLNSKSLSDADKFNKALKLKSDQLAEKEQEIAEREKSLQQLREALNQKEQATERLNKSIKNALLGFGGDLLSVETRDGKVYVSMSNKLLFESGSATVGDKGKEALKSLAEVMNANPDIDIQVEGHTDNDPFRVKPGTDAKVITVRDNWDLSVMRATSVVRVLTEDYNVNPKSVLAAGRGEYFPKANNSTAEGKAQNRRTEIIISPRLDQVLNMLNK